MATPKKKKDLRARLGRTITPKTGGGAGAPVPAPNLGGAPAPDAGADAAPAPAKPAKPASRGIAKPPAALAGPARADLAPPPFAQAPAEPEAPADPFAAGEQVVQQPVVRLEFDDKLVADQEVGKTKRFMIIGVALVGIAAGLVLGAFAGSTYQTRTLFATTVQDGQAIYAEVNDAEGTLTQVQTLVRRAQDAANPSDGSTPAPDFEAMTALRATEVPFQLNDFTSKNYAAFPGLADNLIRYVTLVGRLFEQIQSLTASALREDRREELTRTLAEAGARQQYGAVLKRGNDGGVVASIVYLENGEPDEEGHPRANLRATRGSAPVQMRYYTAGEGEAIEAQPAFVVTVDGATSAPLRDQTSAGDRYKEDLNEINTLLQEIIDLQGDVLTTLHRGLTDVGADLSGGGQ